MVDWASAKRRGAWKVLVLPWLPRQSSRPFSFPCPALGWSWSKIPTGSLSYTAAKNSELHCLFLLPCPRGLTRTCTTYSREESLTQICLCGMPRPSTSTASSQRRLWRGDWEVKVSANSFLNPGRLSIIINKPSSLSLRRLFWQLAHSAVQSDCREFYDCPRGYDPSSCSGNPYLIASWNSASIPRPNDAHQILCGSR